jgi:hypothetical protein
MKNKILDFLDQYIVLVVTALMIVLCAVALNSCKDKPVYVPPSPVQVIEQNAKPVEDSLRSVIKAKEDTLLVLKQQLNKQQQVQTIAEKKAEATIGRLQTALNAKDTGEIITYADNTIEEFNDYIQATNKQDSIQEAVIEKQAAIIVTSRAETDLQIEKYNLLKTAYKVKELEANDWKNEAVKLDRKLKNKKFWNGVWKIGTAAGAVVAGIVFL